MKWIATNWMWLLTWGLLIAVLAVEVFHGLRLKRQAQKSMDALEKRMVENASVKKSIGKTYEERLVDEYRKRGLRG